MVSHLRQLQTLQFPDLPSHLDKKFVNESMIKLRDSLNQSEETRGSQEAKIAKVKRILKRFDDGTMPTELNCDENLWAAKLILRELKFNGEMGVR